MLTDLLQQYPLFQEMPIDQRQAYIRLAQIFQDDADAIWYSAEELSERTHLGTRHQWDKLLSFEPTLHYIQSEMTNRTRVAQRKAFLSLQREASEGDVSAIKHINELSGIMEKKDNNKVVVLHYVPRPTATTTTTTTTTTNTELSKEVDPANV